ncbi:TPA: hypothetical protein QDA96_004492 [Burkholderia vietnamiensis]|uniref:hypothetical protein n=1 Tax=Burkholderia vietnamiensis TaxID=60552 RepID=UPI001591082F|nr:hypothetical protein [Burkholderia vietnamiensis]MDN8112551.1 hypothetical protein [Burkholderia vietnamiensis]HDR8920293.1 hypothetical protein [Burkholderia vietnamiensis]HDR9043766.1 hypothetical protein [Burkholderia vietnamiensis]HDR9069747.1 hypothetical protein [Burkholderia vietnamiensis]HDR9137056.1 hypothetical protein [Burkholderia vietnamiensis]
MFNGRTGLNVIVGVFAAIGLIAVLGAAGMTAMHVNMMQGLHSCREAMHLRP